MCGTLMCVCLCVIALEDEDGSRLVFGRKHKGKRLQQLVNYSSHQALHITLRSKYHFLFERKVKETMLTPSHLD